MITLFFTIFFICLVCFALGTCAAGWPFKQAIDAAISAALILAAAMTLIFVVVQWIGKII